MEQNKKNCPVTGKELVYVGHDEGVMDGNSYYSPVNDSSIIFAVHPFRMNIYIQVKDKSLYSEELKYFKHLDSGQWQEMKKVPHANLLFPMDEEGEEWQKACDLAIQQRDKRIAQRKYWDEHPEEDPRIRPLFIAAEKVEVRPLLPPLGILYYIDFKYEGKNTD
jgi:hypothetical protein